MYLTLFLLQLLHSRQQFIRSFGQIQMFRISFNYLVCAPILFITPLEGKTAVHYSCWRSQPFIIRFLFLVVRQTYLVTSVPVVCQALSIFQLNSTQEDIMSSVTQWIRRNSAISSPISGDKCSLESSKLQLLPVPSSHRVRADFSSKAVCDRAQIRRKRRRINSFVKRNKNIRCPRSSQCSAKFHEREICISVTKYPKSMVIYLYGK